jgi:cytochrome c-type biogenesis protein
MSVPRAASSRSRARTWAGVGATVVVLTVAVIGGLLSPPTGGSAVIAVDRLSSAVTDPLSRLGGRIVWVYAFLLGSAAAFNPCGFGLIPAYVGLYLSEEGHRVTVAARARRALSVSVAVASAFTLLFGATGALFSFASRPIVRALPWLGLGVGVALVVVGGASLAGRPVMLVASERAAGRIGRAATRSNLRGYTAFGLAYGLASLGCAFPLFFALVGTAVSTGSPLSALVAFALYGAGMAAVVAVLTLIVGLFGFGVVARVRGWSRFIGPVGTVLLLLSGGYVVYYWLSAGRLLFA